MFDRASTYSAAKPLDIDVRVDTRGQRVTVRFNNGPATATLGDLLAQPRVGHPRARERRRRRHCGCRRSP